MCMGLISHVTRRQLVVVPPPNSAVRRQRPPEKWAILQQADQEAERDVSAGCNPHPHDPSGLFLAGTPKLPSPRPPKGHCFCRDWKKKLRKQVELLYIQTNEDDVSSRRGQDAKALPQGKGGLLPLGTGGCGIVRCGQ